MRQNRLKLPKTRLLAGKQVTLCTSLYRLAIKGQVFSSSLSGPFGSSGGFGATGAFGILGRTGFFGGRGNFHFLLTA